MLPSLPYLCNCSLLFTELPLRERASAAAAAGFTAVEFWWPFDTATPADREVDRFASAVEDAGVALVGLNFFAGDLAGPDCGLVSLPARQIEFRDAVAAAAGVGERLGVRVFNALYGNRVEGLDPVEQDELAIENLLLASAAVSGFGASVLVEPVSGPKPYPLRTAADTLAVVDRARAAGARSVGFLCDLFHLASNGDDPFAVVEGHANDIAHVQIADMPGRGEPGSGTLDIAAPLAALQRLGYPGWVALEYRPTTPDTPTSLGWLPRSLRAGRADTTRGSTS